MANLDSSKVVVLAGSSLVLYGAYQIGRRLLKPYFSPLKDLPGPPSKSFFFGNLEEIRKAENSILHEEWIAQYGKVMKYKAFFNGDRLFTVDLKALNHILTHSNDYQKPAQARFNLGRLLGDGILITEGDQHRQQRRIMNPSFGPSSIKDLTPIFFQKAQQLRDIWKADVSGNGGQQTIDVLSWLSRATLDVIGLAGFSYKFDALSVNKEPNELNKAFATLFNARSTLNIFWVLQSIFPVLRIIPTSRIKEEDKSLATMRRIGEELLRRRKSEILGEKLDIDGSMEKDTADLKGKDLLSALVRANLDLDLPENQRMSDEDVLAQVPTFLVAGHETTSTETMWCLFALCQRPDIQKRLRDEILSVPTDSPSMDELSALPFLDAVVRETLRVHAAVTGTMRVAMHDDVIPLNEPFVDKKGKSHNEIRVVAGNSIFIPITPLNRSKEIWGEDAHDFNPDRWAKVPEAANSVPGVWGNLLTFLGGARSCIGYRFALVEMKALLFTLLRTFEFQLSLPAEVFEKRTMVVTRPYLKSEKNGSAKMPLIVKMHHNESMV